MLAARATYTAYCVSKFEHVNDILWKKQTKLFFIM